MEKLQSLEQTISLINEGKLLIIAGDDSLLSKLPKGNWIGGTTPYFMEKDGGVFSKELLSVTVLPTYCRPRKIKYYDQKHLEEIPQDYPLNGISFVIVPGLQEIHQTFANKIGAIRGVYNRPLVGWVSGVDLKEIERDKAKVYSGLDLKGESEKVVVMHVDLDEDYSAKVEIINVFEQGESDAITFPEDGFIVKDAYINGKLQNFATYLKEKEVNTEEPLVANYSGAMINTSFESVHHDKGEVHLYAPVFKGVEYKVAKNLKCYKEQFNKEVDKLNIKPVFACNCILNYVYAGLEQSESSKVTGPVTFGEIAYVLLNQTMVYVEFKEKK